MPGQYLRMKRCSAPVILESSTHSKNMSHVFGLSLLTKKWLQKLEKTQISLFYVLLQNSSKGMVNVPIILTTPFLWCTFLMSPKVPMLTLWCMSHLVSLVYDLTSQPCGTIKPDLLHIRYLHPIGPSQIIWTCETNGQ